MRKSVFIAGVLLVLLAAGFWFVGRPAYRKHRETVSMQKARDYLAKGDVRNANLMARQTLLANPNNLEACRMIAEIAEALRHPLALDYRRRAVEIEPSISNKLQLASTALRAQGPPFPLATQTLDDLADTARNDASYHVLRGELSLKMKKPAVAEEEFAEASRLDPTNELHQLNLAVLRLHSTNAVQAAQAKATLERLRAHPQLGAVALRWLVAESFGQKDYAAATRFSQLLLTNKYATLDDRLQHLTLLRQNSPAQVTAFLAETQRGATNSAGAVYGVAIWMINHSLAQETMDWLGSLPAKVRAEQPVPLALVDAYQARKDWAGLEVFLQNQQWNELEFLRLAYLSQAALKQGQEQAADTRWRLALQKAEDRLGALTALLSMATSWRRDQAREELLWQITHRYPRERWALNELSRTYQVTGDTRALNRVYSSMASFNPNDRMAANDYAATSLLLNINLAKAHQAAKDGYLQHPDDAVIASTYALSLHLQNRTREGIVILEKLKPASLQDPQIALYYGVLLAADGQTNKAAPFLALARKARLLPEEKALLAAASPAS